MATTSERLSAVQVYRRGLAFFQDGNYGQAIIELHKAKEAFRRLVIRGCPSGRLTKIQKNSSQ